MPTEIEPNDNRATAQLFTLGSTITGTTSYPYGNDDFFRFDAVARGTLTLTVTLPAPQGTDSTMLYLEVQDGAGTLVANRTFREGAIHFRTYQIGVQEPGTYYLALPSNANWQQNYQIATSFQAGLGLFESGTNDSAGTANASQFDVPVYGNISAPSDQDWFVYTFSGSGAHVVSIDTELGSEDFADYDWLHTLTVAAFDESGTLLGSKEIHDATPLTVAVDGSGNVRVEVFEGPLNSYNTPITQQYRLLVSATDGTGGREVESNGTAASANPLQFGQSVLGQIATIADQDWFSFHVTTAGTITLTTTFASRPVSYVFDYHNVSIRDAAGNVLAADPGPNGHPLSVSVTQPGTYYAVVTDGSYLEYWNDYQLTVDFVGGASGYEDGNNDTNATADALPLNGTIRGSLSSEADVDRFVFQVTAPSVVTLNLSTDYAFPNSNGRPYLALDVTDTQGRTYGTISTNGANLTLGRLESGTYYASVRPSDYYATDGDDRYNLTASTAAATGLPTGTASSMAPTDPGFATAWHLKSGMAGVNAQAVWDDYTGEGITIFLFDRGFDAGHPDLADNVDYGASHYANGTPWSLYTATMYAVASTATARVALAERDGQGAVGVAYNASLATIDWFDYSAQSFQQIASAYGLGGPADIFLDTTSQDRYFSTTSIATMLQARQLTLELVTEGRDGLGTIVIGPAGGALDQGTSLWGPTNDRNKIVVTATDINGALTSYSATGEGILVSAPGGTQTAPVLADGIPDSGTYAGFETEAAAAVVAGIAALMLEANSDLRYRDVQEILSATARQTSPGSASWDWNGSQDWNGGARHFSWEYGFGLVDARAAVRLAESWSTQSTMSNEVMLTATASPHAVIPDANPAGIYSSVTLGALDIEWMQLELHFTHSFLPDLAVVLISPSGTITAPLVPTTDSFAGAFVIDVSAYRGENAAGIWTIGVADLAGEDIGTLDSWTLRAYGSSASANDTYIYTDEFGSLTENLAARQVLNDTNGGRDLLNAAAVSAALRIDLAGGSSQIAGRALSVAPGTIEDAYGGDGGDTLSGNALANTLQGARGDDMLFGATGADTLLGGTGNDRLDGGTGADRLDGGEGFDIAAFGSATGPVTIRVLGLGDWEAVFSDGTVQRLLNIEMADAGSGLLTAGSAGDDQVNGGSSADALAGGLGNDYLAGGSGDDTLSGGAGFDWLWAGPGGDSLDGGAEKDNINGEAGDDVIDAGAGNDRITGRDGNDTISAGDGDDWVGVWNDWGEDPSLNYFPESGNDSISGDAGDDVLSAGLGTDTVYGGIGNDYLAGEQDDDLLFGGEGFDWLWAGAGADTLDGGAEKDNLNGESGNDLIFAGDGNDRICGQQDDDEIHAGNGNDWVGVWNDWGEDPALNYFPEGGNDLIFGDAGNDVLSAGFGRDTVHGGADHDYVAGEQDDDQLFGNDGIDWLWGGSGNDSMDGGAGDDHLIGESGADLLTGGLGADIFEFRSISHAGHRILDFNAGQGDRIDVSELLSEQNYAGSDPFADGRLSRVQSGADVLFRFDGTLLATIENTTLAQINDGVFIV